MYCKQLVCTTSIFESDILSKIVNGFTDLPQNEAGYFVVKSDVDIKDFTHRDLPLVRYFLTKALLKPFVVYGLDDNFLFAVSQYEVDNLCSNEIDYFVSRRCVRCENMLTCEQFHKSEFNQLDLSEIRIKLATYKVLNDLKTEQIIHEIKRGISHKNIIMTPTRKNKLSYKLTITE
jgi:hypothetical protein